MKSVSLKEEEEEEKKKKKKKKKKVAVTSKGLKFAKKQLKKHGWKKGKGLGKQENGISEALKVKMKCNTAGVGHESAEFTFHWWDHLFNSSAANIAVEAGQLNNIQPFSQVAGRGRLVGCSHAFKHSFLPQYGVQVRKISERAGPVTNKPPRQAQKGNMLYGRFVKAATLISGTEEPVSPASTSDQEEGKLDLSTVRRLTDEEVLQACGGRTVHRGARHGLTMSAKLARLEEQEKAFLASSVQRKEGRETAPTSSCPRLQHPRQAKRRRKRKLATKKSQTEGACIKGKPKKKKKKKKNAREMNGH